MANTISSCRVIRDGPQQGILVEEWMHEVTASLRALSRNLLEYVKASLHLMITHPIGRYERWITLPHANRIMVACLHVA